MRPTHSHTAIFGCVLFVIFRKLIATKHVSGGIYCAGVFSDQYMNHHHHHHHERPHHVRHHDRALGITDTKCMYLCIFVASTFLPPDHTSTRLHRDGDGVRGV